MDYNVSNVLGEIMRKHIKTDLYCSSLSWSGSWSRSWVMSGVSICSWSRSKSWIRFRSWSWPWSSISWNKQSDRSGNNEKAY